MQRRSRSERCQDGLSSSCVPCLATSQRKVKTMFIKLTLIAVLSLAVNTPVSAQGGANDNSEEVPAGAHYRPPCRYGNASCVWGSLLDATREYNVRPMKRGPIDLCRAWDSNCSAPVQTVCKLHGGHGWRDHSADEGSYFFVLPRNQSWVVKPRVTGSHLSWEPTLLRVNAGSRRAGITYVQNFFLRAQVASTNLCRQ